MSEYRADKVKAGLVHCMKEPEATADCGDCPYRDTEEFCISRLCRDAFGLIVLLEERLAVKGGGEK